MSIYDDLPTEIVSLLIPHVMYDGKVIQFNLSQHEHVYNYYRGRNGAMYCYSPHKSTTGHYFVWTYQPVGKGSRTGHPTQWEVKDVVRCAHRKTAIAKALKRWQKNNRYEQTTD